MKALIPSHKKLSILIDMNKQLSDIAVFSAAQPITKSSSGLGYEDWLVARSNYTPINRLSAHNNYLIVDVGTGANIIDSQNISEEARLVIDHSSWTPIMVGGFGKSKSSGSAAVSVESTRKKKVTRPERLGLLRSALAGATTARVAFAASQTASESLFKNADFSPSVELIKHWINGVEFARKTAMLNIDELATISDVDIASLQKTFAEKLIGEILSGFHSFRIQNDTTELLLFSNDEANSWLEFLLSNCFEIQPKDMTSFIVKAEQELYEYFLSSELAGEWGKISCVSRTIVAHLNPAPEKKKRTRNSKEIDI